MRLTSDIWSHFGKEGLIGRMREGVIYFSRLEQVAILDGGA